MGTLLDSSRCSARGLLGYLVYQVVCSTQRHTNQTPRTKEQSPAPMSVFNDSVDATQEAGQISQDFVATPVVTSGMFCASVSSRWPP